MSLAEEMIAAAPVLERANERCGFPPGTPWKSDSLVREAEAVRSQDEEREADIEGLAREMCALTEQDWDAPWMGNGRKIYRDVARGLIESGWRKGEPA